jgi:glycosyltransferase involved in cell wall biosynthesis
MTGAGPVLHVDSGASWRGGQRQVLLLARGLAERGVRCALACPRGSPLFQRAEAAGIEVRHFRAGGDLDVRAARNLARIARATGAMIIHAHDARSHAIARLASLYGRPGALVVSRRVAFASGKGMLGGVKYRGVAAYLAVSDAAREGLLAIGVAPDRIHVVPDGVAPPGPIEAMDWRRHFGLAPGATILGCVGALTPEKGHADLVEALAVLPDPTHHLVLVGAGPEAGALRDLAAGHGMAERVHQTGFLDEPLAALAGFDIFVQPSRLEGFGSAVLDALALGVPVLTTAAGGLPELVEADVSAVVVPPGNPPAMARALDRLSDPELRRRLAAAGPARAALFTVDRLVDRTLAVYAGCGATA